jgi:hypothetical protein
MAMINTFISPCAAGSHQEICLKKFNQYIQENGLRVAVQSGITRWCIKSGLYVAAIITG